MLQSRWSRRRLGFGRAQVPVQTRVRFSLRLGAKALYWPLNFSVPYMSKATNIIGPAGSRGLYDPAFEHDSCGVGFICQIKGKASNTIVTNALQKAGVNVVGPEADWPPGSEVVRVLIDPTDDDWMAVGHSDGSLVMVTSEEPDEATVVDAVIRGANAVVAPDSTPSAVADAVRLVADGGAALAPCHVRAIAQRARATEVRTKLVLTKREHEILVSIASGNSASSACPRFPGQTHIHPFLSRTG